MGRRKLQKGTIAGATFDASILSNPEHRTRFYRNLAAVQKKAYEDVATHSTAVSGDRGICLKRREQCLPMSSLF